jgi:pilus assembly protein CpaE
MNARWYVHASGAYHTPLSAVVRTLDPTAELHAYKSPAGLRNALAATSPAHYGLTHAAVYNVAEMPAINLAAALVADGHACEVLLMADDATDSLRRRASAAGISRVIDMAEYGYSQDVLNPRMPEEPFVVPDAPPLPEELAAYERAAAPAQKEGGLLPQVESGEAAAPAIEAPTPAQEVPTPLVLAPAKNPRELAEVLPSCDSLPEREESLVERVTQTPAVALAPAAPILTFVSGRGGCGKSAIASVMACCAARWGMKVALVDLDLSFGNLFGYFGLPGPVDVSALATSLDGCFALGKRCQENLTLFGPCARPEYAELVLPQVGAFLTELSQQVDVVLVDGASMWGDGVAQAAQLSERLLVVCDERSGALTSLSRAMGLAQRLGIARTRLVRLMNRCDPRRRDEAFLMRAEVDAHTARSYRLLEGGSEVAELLSAGQVGALSASDSYFAVTCAQVAARLFAEIGILPQNEEAQALRYEEEPKASLFGFLRGAV